MFCVGMLLVTGCSGGKTSRLVVEPGEVTLPADGREHRAFAVRGTAGSGLTATWLGGSSAANLRLVQAENGRVDGWLASPVLPSGQEIRLTEPGSMGSVRVRFTLDPTDSYGDGTPDFLRLHDAGDRQAFRGWFAAIAEAVADLPPERVPAEVNDCSALLRYAYREALRNHDDRWLNDVQWEGVPGASIRQYHYPETPLGASLFRITSAIFEPSDLSDGSFAQFADARTLMQRNTHFVSRDVRVARRGDLFFFRQLEQNSPYHSMIVTGDDADWVVYDTGPIGKAKGEVRRVSTEDLLHHPDLRWRPVAGNSNFLGVYRWNILREGE
jgi:uncharacterized protein